MSTRKYAIGDKVYVNDPGTRGLVHTITGFTSIGYTTKYTATVPGTQTKVEMTTSNVPEGLIIGKAYGGGYRKRRRTGKKRARRSHTRRRR